jgi:hypothetical protein
MLVVLFCLQFSLLLWSFGLTRLWEQGLFTAFSLVGLILALLPQWWDRETGEDPRLCAGKSWQRLTAYPVFWCGIGVAVLCVIQHLNPAYGYEESTVDWRAFPIRHTPWLPRGVASPFEKMSALRFLLVFAGPWLMVCYLKAGVIRRNSVIRMLEFIALSLVAYGVLILAQKQTGASGIYWNFEVFPDFVGTIPYKNRAAAILNLGMTLMMALYFLHLKAMRMELHHSGPHLIVFVGVIFVYGLLWTTQSRTGLLIGSMLMVTFLLLTLIPSLRDGSTWTHKLILSGAMVLLGLVGILYTKSVPDRSETLERFGDLREEIRQWHSNESTRITLDMLQQRVQAVRITKPTTPRCAIWMTRKPPPRSGVMPSMTGPNMAEFGIVGGLLRMGVDRVPFFDPSDPLGPGAASACVDRPAFAESGRAGLAPADRLFDAPSITRQ